MSGKTYQPPWILSMWPGLPSLWLRGDPYGFALAVLFGGLLQLALLATFVWPGWLRPEWRGVLWVGLIVGWLATTVRSRQVTVGGRPHGDPESLYREAQREYLKGNWSYAETVLLRLLSWDSEDAEVRMMLASLYRRTGRCRAAMEQLSAVEASPTASQWQWDVSRERQLVARNRQEQQERDCRSKRGELWESSGDRPQPSREPRARPDAA